MEKIFNKTIYEILQERGMTNCIELIKENNLNVSIQPTYNAYQYSAQKVKDHVDKLKKTKSRPKIALELHEYLESEFIFLQAELTKRGPHVVADETLNIKGSLLRKKLKTQELKTEKLFETENTVK